MIIIKKSIGTSIFLSIITCGIYYLYWEYCLVKNIRAIKNDESSCTGEMLCLIFVPLYSLYWWFTRGEYMKKKFQKSDYYVSGSGITYLLLSFFGLSIIAMAIMQNDFNSLLDCDSQSRHSNPSYESPLLEKEKREGCYVATAVYGSYDCPAVWTLRRYRDYTLAKTFYGRIFIRLYYAVSPTFVKWFGETQWFKNMWKGKLDRMVLKLQSQGVESTPYEDKNQKGGMLKWK